jgi:ferric iron reductase protein FhuF
VLQLPPEFVRNSCCLFYRLPEGSLCGDCVLRVRRDSA